VKFLVDENAPYDVLDFLRSRGHIADYVGESFAKSSPDALLLLAAELHGYIVVTFDRDFKRLIQQVPAGSRRAVESRAGRISFSCKEPLAFPRLQESISVIEFLYDDAERKGKRFIIQISATSYTVVG
jgi:predicted nuclease of predicted toxin-antitoxin system